MAIGSKSLFTALAAVATGVAAWGFDLVGLDWLGALDTGSALLVGTFATLLGALVYRMGRLDEPSESSSGRGSEDARSPAAPRAHHPAATASSRANAVSRVRRVISPRPFPK